MSNVTVVDIADLPQVLADSTVPVVVKYHAVWCKPCRMMAPMIEELADVYAGKVMVVSVDVDGDADILRSTGVRSVPTLQAYAAGAVGVDGAWPSMEWQVVGAVGKTLLVSKIDSLLPDAE